VLVGSLTQVSTGTVSGTVPRNRFANQALNVNLGAAAAGSVGLIFHDITRASRSYVDAVVSGNVVRLAQPMFVSSDVTEDTGVTNGDSFAVERAAKLCINSLTSSGGSGFIEVKTSWIIDPSGIGASTSTVNATIIASRFDSTVSISNQRIVANNNFANQLSGQTLLNADLNGGIITTPIMSGGRFDGDIIVHGQPQISPGSRESLVEYTFLYADAGAFAPWTIFGVLEGNGAAQIYGSYSFFPAQPGGAIIYTGPNYPSSPPSCVQSFPGINYLVYPQTIGTAVDQTVSGSLQVYEGRTLSCAAMDLPVNGASGTGFGGIVFNGAFQGIVFAFGLNNTSPTATSSYVLPNIPCPAGQSPVSDGAHYTSCATPGGGGGGTVTLAGDTVGPSNANQTKGTWGHAIPDPALSGATSGQPGYLGWNGFAMSWNTNIQTSNLPVAGDATILQTVGFGPGNWTEIAATTTAFNSSLPAGTITTVGAGFTVLGSSSITVPNLGAGNFRTTINASFNFNLASTGPISATEVSYCVVLDAAPILCANQTMVNFGSSLYGGIDITESGSLPFSTDTLAAGAHTVGVAAREIAGASVPITINAPYLVTLSAL
jgi:hypothetical protein